MTIHLIKKQVISFWWVFLFALLCFICYEQGMKLWNDQHKILSKQLHELRLEKEAAIFLQKELSLQIESQEDPEWIELTLMSKLGLVPEGQKKVYFIE